MEKVTFEYKPNPVEGADILIEQANSKLNFRVTSSDEDKNPLAGLTHCLVLVQEICASCFTWYDGNFSYEWTFVEVCKDELQIEIKKYEEKKGKIIKDFGVVFKITCSYFQFVEAVTNELDKVLINDGFSGNFEDWMDDFPISQYLKLKWILQNPNFGGYLDSDVLTFKEEVELLNQIVKAV